MNASSNQVWEWTGHNQLHFLEKNRVLPKEGEVEVRLKSIGICGTDLHIMSGHVQFGTPPLPLGHELSGVVERVGEGVQSWRLGDRVCIDPLIGCGICKECGAGRKHRCPQGGEIGLQLPGGWQQFLIVPAGNLYRIPESIPFAEATQAETLHCCISGIDKLNIRLGMHAAVIGDGPTGLLYLQLLKLAGAGKVALIGMRSERLLLGMSLGADEIVEANTGLPHESFDIVIDAAGTVDSIRQSIELLKKGGQLLLFGLPGSPILVDVQEIVLKELQLYGSTNAPDVWYRVIELMASGLIQIEPLITHRFTFEQLDLALALAREAAPGVIKIVVAV